MLRVMSFENNRDDLAQHPIEPSWIKEGTPVARMLILTESPDKNLTSGLWDCTAGKFTWIFYCDEIVNIIEGEVNVWDGDRVLALRPGSVAYFPRGLETVWEVPKYIKKSFVLREPQVSGLRKAAWLAKEKVKELLKSRHTKPAR